MSGAASALFTRAAAVSRWRERRRELMASAPVRSPCAAAAAARSNWSVTLDMALTTTTGRLPAAKRPATMAAERPMAAGSSTDVPPNFMMTRLMLFVPFVVTWSLFQKTRKCQGTTSVVSSWVFDPPRCMKTLGVAPASRPAVVWASSPTPGALSTVPKMARKLRALAPARLRPRSARPFLKHALGKSFIDNVHSFRGQSPA